MKQKTFFTVFKGLSFGEKIKNPEKIVDTSFNAFYQNFISKYYFFPNDEKWSKTMKNAFYFIKKALFILKIFKYLYIHFPPFFSPSAIALEVDSRKS